MNASETFDFAKTSGAIFSTDRVHRYRLWRQWDPMLPTCAFIGLNPSTADEVEDDPTIRRCISFSKAWGFGRFEMLNLFAFRSTEPLGLLDASDPVGEKNNESILAVCAAAGRVVFSWGSHKKSKTLAGLVLRRSENVISLLSDTTWEARRNPERFGHLGRNSDGAPKHPLYLAATTPFRPL